MFGLDPIKLLVSWLVILRSSKISLLKTSITSESSRLLDSAEKSFIDKSSSSEAFINNERGILRFPLSIKFK